MALQDAGSSLRADREVVLQAIKQNSKALQFAAHDLHEDDDVLLEAGLSSTVEVHAAEGSPTIQKGSLADYLEPSRPEPYIPTEPDSYDAMATEVEEAACESTAGQS